MASTGTVALRRRTPWPAWLSSRAFARLLTAATPSVYVLLLLVGPIVLVALYSFNLRTNITGQPTGFSTANWSDLFCATWLKLRST